MELFVGHFSSFSDYREREKSRCCGKVVALFGIEADLALIEHRHAMQERYGSFPDFAFAFTLGPLRKADEWHRLDVMPLA